MPDLLTMIKSAAMEAVREGNPATYLYGTVISINPLEIQVDEDMKLVLSEDFLQLTNAVRDYTVNMEDAENGTTRKMIIKNALRIGEKVIMLQQQGGQNYLIFDRRNADATEQ